MSKSRKSSTHSNERAEVKKERVKRSKVKAEPVPWESATTGLTLGVLPKNADVDIMINPSTMTDEQFEAIIIYFQKVYLQKTGERMTKPQLRALREKLRSQQNAMSLEEFVSSTLEELTNTTGTTTRGGPRTQMDINSGVPKLRPDIETMTFPCKICNREIYLSQLPFHEALCIKNQPPGAPGYTPNK